MRPNECACGGSHISVRSLIKPFEVLFEADLPRYELPKDLERIYGSLGFADRSVYSNFVTSVDGVATVDSGRSADSVLISGRNEADRFLIGLLRACADAVLLGAGTLRASPRHHWKPEHVYPDLAVGFAALRANLGRKQQPRLVVLTASGDIDVAYPAIADGATIVTTQAGAKSMAGRLPDTCDVIQVGVAGMVDMGRAIAELRDRGHQLILTEGGPHVMGELVEHGLLDEAFITISPVLAGRDGSQRLGMIAGAELLPERQEWSRLLSARRHGDFLFLRYDLRSSARP